MHGYHRSALFVVKITGGGVQARLEEVQLAMVNISLMHSSDNKSLDYLKVCGNGNREKFEYEKLCKEWRNCKSGK